MEYAGLGEVHRKCDSPSRLDVNSEKDGRVSWREIVLVLVTVECGLSGS